ncbi:hypothetical protein [Maribacter sp. 2307ULW6-5]|uniref:hypothetical protein n=1 Tax=Maribacter sp. 2307ULW6-5 TaxID=3386275 RepID=UPI0039BD8129
MKTKILEIQRFLWCCMALFAPLSLSGQTFYALQVDHKIRAEARDVTARYQPRLVMGVDQALEFQNTVARFLVKKRAVERDTTLSAKAKYEILKQLSGRETSAMAHVLESYRWQEYMRLKPRLQPIREPQWADRLIANDQ